MISRTVFAFALLVASASVLAADLEGEFALRMNKAVLGSSSLNGKDKMAFHGGVVTKIPLNESVSFRTGGLLVLRDSEASVDSITATVSRMFLDVPAQLAFGTDKVMGYAGMNLGLKLSSSCSVTGSSTCSILDEKSMVFQPVLGGQVAVSQFKLGAFFEIETEYSRNWKQSALGLTFGMAF